ncbi:hypothetical protein TOT_020000773 [Theileria orientalis strain Shintoku]|uniref:Uncharacterized protein n=1 Tax=Theileria orientalis strain Shintoku TaxID=869250 RepID=J4C8B9_THEOR|nr:hypothetical protein TOT_020000773 [Theileria orientalis strain Shintoku]PVC51255.1 hypothetical protein MACL_00001713 [Theileria orientalis]BAM40518.1 hypothetical protein TOT_020000773 [Theileria orientalis strain Shintoku]|eukprot:XP_009690819.1 hypothetical protein TOT_020000773 [Theileria orientalis strain Shintoku]
MATGLLSTLVTPPDHCNHFCGSCAFVSLRLTTFHF